MTTEVDNLEYTPRILGADGRPYDLGALAVRTGADALVTKASDSSWLGGYSSTVSSYLKALGLLDADPRYRVLDPYANHPWVYLAVTLAALNVSQVPLEVMRETDATVSSRRVAVTKGRSRGPVNRSGRGRLAMKRYGEDSRRDRGYRLKSLEPMPEHPLQSVIQYPGGIASSRALLMYFTTMYFKLRGEAFWVLLDEEWEPVSWTQPDRVSMIFPVSPDLMTEEMNGNVHIGWRMRVQRGYEKSNADILLLADEVVQFKLPDPCNPIRGLSPLSALAANVTLDMNAMRANIDLAKTGNEPKGLLEHKGVNGASPFKNKEARDEFLDAWEQRHGGLGRERRTGMLWGGWAYTPCNVTPKDSEFLGSSNMNRDTILAVFMTPKSSAGLGESGNFATQLSQDRNYWTLGLIPMMKFIEWGIDSTLFYTQPDDVMLLFDLSRVDALKAGLQTKVVTVKMLCGPEIHMSPKRAWEMVGEDVESYEGDDVTLVSPALGKLDTVLNPPEPPPAAGPPAPPGAAAPGATGSTTPPSETGAGGGTPETGAGTARDPNKAEGQPTAKSAILRARPRHGLIWRDVVRKVQQPHEERFRVAWRTFVSRAKAAALEKFDKTARRLKLKGMWVLRDGDFDPEEVLLDEASLGRDLRSKFDPIYTDELEQTFDYTVDEIGIARFSLDDPRLQAALDAREQVLVGTAPKTIQENVRRSLRKGIENGETVQELRTRVASSYDISASSSKALTVARTESASFMNDVRETMFDAQGFEKREWVTAGDEHVRESHVLFGQQGPQPADFNYLSLTGEDGTLERPGDPDAPAGEVINCRCVHVPA